MQGVNSVHLAGIHQIAAGLAYQVYGVNHRVISLESSYGPKKIAPNYLKWNFTEVVINADKVNPVNLVAVPKLWEIYLYKLAEGIIIALQTLDCHLTVTVIVHKFIEVNFSKLTDNTQIFRNDFDCIHYHLCKISQIIGCKFFAQCDFLEMNSL